MLSLFSRLFGKNKDKQKSVANEASKKVNKVYDPLDIIRRGEAQGWVNSPPNSIQRSINDFPTLETFETKTTVTDSSNKNVAVMDDSDAPIGTKLGNSYTVPEQLKNWYMAQSFIGYQACAIIAQHWLVDKACSMAAEDAISNGWEIKAVGDDEKLSKEDRDKLRSYDVPFALKANLAELVRFKNIFGIRVALFEIESDDPDYYEKPFNIDGITEGSYKGISQVDPYWMMPMMTAESTADPANMYFYEPEFWVISGKKYHRSHLIIARGPQPADVLKPTYIFGGIPMTQRIYERVYAAERTANEAPLLALSKRTTALHVDIEKAMTNQSKFEEKLMFWIKYRDNHAVKVLGKEETMEQFDTNLSDFDSVIMNQYQIVSAIAETPATKLLGTSPKGFNATGEFEQVSYNKKQESIQEHDMMPMASRHYLILGRSLGIQIQVEVVMNSVDSVTMQQLAELNDKKADTRQKYINMGSASPDEVRDILRDDKHSGFNRLTDEVANEDPGMSPENIANFQKAGAAEQKSEAEETTAGATSVEKTGTTEPTHATPEQNPEDDAEGAANPRPTGQAPIAPNTPNPPLKLSEPGIVSSPENNKLTQAINLLAQHLIKLEEHLIPNGQDINADTFGKERTSKPSVTGMNSSVSGAGAIIKLGDPSKYPKMKLGGLMLAIENPRGTIRQGMDIDGNSWSSKMPHHYGYIKGVMGADGDELDCFVGPNLHSDRVFVINQNEPRSGEFDEHKVMLGFDSADEAKQAYHAAYQTDWKGFGDIVECSMDEFKSWIKSTDGCTTPLQAACIGQTGNAPQEVLPK